MRETDPDFRRAGRGRDRKRLRRARLTIPFSNPLPITFAARLATY